MENVRIPLVLLLVAWGGMCRARLEPIPTSLRDRANECGHKTVPADCFVLAESEPHAGGEVEVLSRITSVSSPFITRH